MYQKLLRGLKALLEKDFVTWIGVGLLVMALICVLTTLIYINGRVLLPEMGLHAPRWSTWFWSMMIIVLPTSVFRACIRQKD